MTNQKLNPKILSKLKKKFPKKTENALYVKLIIYIDEYIYLQKY